MTLENQGICLLSCIPVRKEPDSTSEMVNQLLFGELYTILEIKKQWIKLASDWDGYTGWISRNQAALIPDHAAWARQPSRVQMEIHSQYPLPDGTYIRTLPGSNLPGAPEIMGQVTGATLVAYAQLFLNTPYLWGGRSLYGIDCSGLMQVVYKMAGIKLLRDAKDQASQGAVIDFAGMAEPGDLAFFDNEDGKIIHVGMVCGPAKMIHAHGKVRIDEFDQQGIFNRELGIYTHKLRIIKRVIPGI